MHFVDTSKAYTCGVKVSYVRRYLALMHWSLSLSLNRVVDRLRFLWAQPDRPRLTWMFDLRGLSIRLWAKHSKEKENCSTVPSVLMTHPSLQGSISFPSSADDTASLVMKCCRDNNVAKTKEILKPCQK